MFPMSQEDSENQSSTAVITEIKKPKLYRVLMHNDDYSTMEFVIDVLQRFFAKNYDEAMSIMLKVHHEGLAVCGIYTLEVAETKILQVSKYARKHEYPLKCSMQQE
ncbi:MAG: ATP-dependent Clp protease adapter ClpS [Bacteriovoracaceae bacterium]|nr:ATP-dependent Clp protease adapter ClpS [Bacteriovoracaceae bacterium]